MTHDMSAKAKTDTHFRAARAAATSLTSKQISDEQAKATSTKSARLKAARLAKMDADAVAASSSKLLKRDGST